MNKFQLYSISFKKSMLCLFALLAFSSVFAQKNSKAEQVDLNNIKNFYKRLKVYKINTDEELVWKYTYGDTSETRLKNLGVIFEKENLKTVEIKQRETIEKSYFLVVSEIKKYNPEELNTRVNYLNDIARVYKTLNYTATIGAENIKKQEDLNTYKKVR